MTSPLELLIQKYSAALVEATTESRERAGRTDDPYQVGRTSGFYMALTMLLIRARSLGIDPEVLGLEGVDPDDLV